MSRGPGTGWRNVGASLAGAAAMITIITLASRLLGFARWMLQARTVGYAEVGNAYASANTLPNVLFEVAAGGALAGALIPLLAIPLAAHLRADVDRIASAMLTWALIVLVPLAGIVMVAARPLAGFFLRESGTGAELDLTTYFLRIFALQIPLYGIGVVLTGVLQAQKKFFWPAFAPILSTLTVMAAYLVFQATAAGAQGAPELLPVRAAAWLAWGTTAGVAAMSLPLFAPALRTGVRFRARVRFPAGVARRAVRLVQAGIGALLAQQLAVLVTVWLANNRGGSGVWPVFQYTQAVYLLPYAVLAVPLATSVFPRLADRIAAKDLHGFTTLAGVTTRAVVLLSALGAALLVAVAGAITYVFIGIGRGDPDLMHAMTGTLTVMAPGLVGFGVLFHVSRALYALERARLAVLAAAGGWLSVVIVSLGVNWVLVPHGIDGPSTLLALGIGNSVGMLVAGAVVLLALRRATGPGVTTGLARSGGTVLLGGAVGALLGRLVADAFSSWWTGVLGVAAATAPGVGTSIMAAGAGAIVCLIVVGGALWLGDRESVRAILPGGALLTTTPQAELPHSARREHAPSDPSLGRLDGESVPPDREPALPDVDSTTPECESSPRLRVALVLGSSAGGVVRHVEQIARVLTSHDEPADPFSVRVLGPREVGGHFHGQTFMPVPIGPRPHPRDIRTIAALRTNLRTADVVHAHGLRAGALTVLATRFTRASRRPRVVVTLHNVAVGSRRTRALSRVLERTVARGADVVLGVSMDIVASLRALGATEAGRALVPAPTGGAVRSRTSPEVRAELGCASPTALIVTVGRLAPQKGLNTLLDAAHLLDTLDLGNARTFLWCVAGGGPLGGELEARIARDGLRVRLLGSRGDVPDLLVAADVVVSTAVWEGQPIGIQEALRAGAAIVATDAGGTAEVTGPGGAVIVPVDDARAVAEQIARLLRDHDARDAQAAAAIQRARELPTLDQVVTQLTDVYRGRRRPSSHP